MYKAVDTTMLDQKSNSLYQGTYYGEVIYDPSGRGVKRDVPHGRGIWVGKDGWIWLQWFENGNPINDEGKFIWINTRTKQLQVATIEMIATHKGKVVRSQVKQVLNEDGSSNQSGISR